MSAQANEFSAVLIRGSDVKPEAVQWLWEGWLAPGMLHVLAGAPGCGKTTLALSLASTVSRSGTWPNGSHAPMGDVLIWSGEDHVSTTLVPRLMAAGADMSRIHFVDCAVDKRGPRPFDPASDMGQLLNAVRQHELKPLLLLVDPIVSAVAGDSHKNSETRRSLQPLVDLAKDVGCAVLGISHFAKGTAGRDVAERVTGSLAFGAMARVVMAASKRNEEQGGGRLLCRGKSNIGPDEGGFLYDLQMAAVPGHEPMLASRVVWGELLEGGARALLAQAEQPEEVRSERDEARNWLADVLMHERQSATEILKAAERNGHSRRTVQRAATDLGVRKTREGFGPKAVYFWSLPPCAPQNHHARQQKTPALMDEAGTHEEFEVGEL